MALEYFSHWPIFHAATMLYYWREIHFRELQATRGRKREASGSC